MYGIRWDGKGNEYEYDKLIFECEYLNGQIIKRVNKKTI